VAVGGAHTLTEFHLSGVHTIDPPWMLAAGLQGSCDLPTLFPRGTAQRSRALRPVTTGNAYPAMSYRNCWHIFSPGLSRQRHVLSLPRLVPVYDTGHANACSNFRPVTKIPHCCLWRGSFKPQVAGRPLRPAKDRWLGYPTPNPARAHPSAAPYGASVAGVTGTNVQRLTSYAPLGRPSPQRG